MSRSNNRKWNEFRARVISKEQARLGSRLLTCAMCGRTDLDPKQPPHTPTSIELDHITPVSRGGAEFPGHEGVRILCHPCNRRRGNRPDADVKQPTRRDEKQPVLRVGWYSRFNDGEGRALPVSQPWFGDERWWNGTEFLPAPDDGWPARTVRPPDDFE